MEEDLNKVKQAVNDLISNQGLLVKRLNTLEEQQSLSKRIQDMESKLIQIQTLVQVQQTKPNQEQSKPVEPPKPAEQK